MARERTGDPLPVPVAVLVQSNDETPPEDAGGMASPLTLNAGVHSLAGGGVWQIPLLRPGHTAPSGYCSPAAASFLTLAGEGPRPNDETPDRRTVAVASANTPQKGTQWPI